MTHDHEEELLNTHLFMLEYQIKISWFFDI